MITRFLTLLISIFLISSCNEGWNKTSKEELRELYFLNAYQIDKLLVHIEKNGKLLSYLELQTIAGFDVQTIQNLLPFITIKSSVTTKQLLANINQYIIMRDQFYLQEQKI